MTTPRYAEGLRRRDWVLAARPRPRRQGPAGRLPEFLDDLSVDALDGGPDVGQRADGRQRNQAGEQRVLDDVRAAFVGDEREDAFHGPVTSRRIWMNHQ